ncbi:MAG: ATP-binding protein [Bacteroidia bacterium]
MLISIKVQNFRSIKEEQAFSLEASGGKSKPDNYFEVDTPQGSIKLLAGAVVYGPNASGKSNFFRAVSALKWFVENAAQLKVGERIACYEPFRLDTATATAPVSFEVVFIVEHVRYTYAISFGASEVVAERLMYYPEGKKRLVYEREKHDAQTDTIKLGKSVGKKGIDLEIFKNQLFLSRFGSEKPHPQLTKVFAFFQELDVWNASDEINIQLLKHEMAARLTTSGEDSDFARKVSELVSVSDTGIAEIFVREARAEDFKLPEFIPDDVKEKIFQENKMRTFARHARYDGAEVSGFEDFELEEESVGTQALFAIDGLLLKKLEQGGVVFIDEFNNSLHPHLARFLVRLFLSKVANPHHAQLVIATHEIELMTKDMLRQDQIWFTEKDKRGQTTLYAADDFDDVRDDSAFDRLYLNGKFLALPRLKTSRFLLQTPQA